MTHGRYGVTFCCGVACMALLLPEWRPVNAAVFDVTTEAQLRSALYNAQSNGQNDVIYVEPGRYLLDEALVYDASEAYSLTIQGTDNGAVIDGVGGTRILYMWSRANDTNAAITLANLVFTNGYVNNESIAGVHVRTQRGDLTVRDCQFLRCRATSFLLTADTGGLFARVENLGRLTCERNTFNGNAAKGTAGGANLSGGNGGPTFVVNNLFVANDAPTKGGGAFVRVTYGNVDIKNNTFAANTSSAGGYGGAGLYVEVYGDDCLVTVANNILWTNVTGNGVGEDLFVDDDKDENAVGAIVKIQFNDVGDYDCHVGNRLTAEANTNTNPKFTATFSLQTNSPCIDAGTNFADMVVDHNQVARPLDGDNNGKAYADMGAFEYANPLADSDGDGFRDADEVTANTNPTNSSSFLSITGLVTVASGKVRVSWMGGTSVVQVLQRAAVLSNGTATVWTDVFTNRPPTARSTNYVDSGATNVTGFYRIRIP